METKWAERMVVWWGAQRVEKKGVGLVDWMADRMDSWMVVQLDVQKVAESVVQLEALTVEKLVGVMAALKAFFGAACIYGSFNE